MTVVDFSHDGCGVRCAASLKAGERLQLDVPGRGTASVLVRWAAGDKAGLSFASSSPEAPVGTPRAHERVSVDGEVAMRRAGKLHFRVHLYDLSPDGCKAEFVDRPELGERLWIRFNGMEALDAHVRWIVGARAGMKFVRPIHSAVFDLLLARLGATTPG